MKLRLPKVGDIYHHVTHNFIVDQIINDTLIVRSDEGKNLGWSEPYKLTCEGFFLWARTNLKLIHE